MKEDENMNNTSNNITHISELLCKAYAACQHSQDTAQLNNILNNAERAVILLRYLIEQSSPLREVLKTDEDYSTSKFAGSIKVNEFGWVHIKLNFLLPNCKYKTPSYLQNTLSTLLMDYQKMRGALPYFNKAMLIIEEHCDINNRQIFDQDNKGWKAIPNAIKGLIVPDDDQFTLELALLSKQSEEACCHIYVVPSEDVGEYFSIRSGDFAYYI